MSLAGPAGAGGVVFGVTIGGDDAAGFGASVGAATAGGGMVGVALVGGEGSDGAAADGDNLTVVGFFVGAATMGGKMVGVALVVVVCGGFGGAVAEGGLIGAAVVG